MGFFRNKISIALLVFSISSLGKQGIVYHGRILKADGTPLESNNVNLRIQIKSPGTEDCLMYEESRSVDMTGSNGVFVFTLNTGVGRTDSTGYTLPQIFSNRSTFSFTHGECSSGSTYTPSATDSRKFNFYFREGASSPWDTIASEDIGFAPLAMESLQLGGYTAGNFCRVEDAGVPQTTTPLTSANYTELLALVNGTSTKYLTKGSTGAVLPNLTNPSSPPAGSIWYESGVVKYSTGSGFPQVLGTTSGAVSGDNITTGTIAGNTSINISGNITTTGTVNASGNITSTGNITTTGSISTTGNITTSGNVSANTSSITTASVRNLLLNDSTSGTPHTITLQAPTTVPTNYTLKLPAADGSASQVLSTDGSGNLSWSTPAVTSGVSVTSPITNSGTASTPNISIQQANGSQPGYLSSGDWTTFNNKQSSTLSSGSVWVGNGSSVATAISPSGDVSMTNAGVFTVTKIQNKTVSSTSPTSAGQVLRYDGSTQYAPTYLSLADIRSTLTGNAQTFPANCSASQTLTWNVVTDTLTCTNIAVSSSAISGLAASATTDTTNASNISSGTLPTARMPALTGDVTTSANTVSTTIANGAVTATKLGSDVGVWSVSSGNIYRSSGYVGIGTSTPSFLLHVNNTSLLGDIRLGSGTLQTIDTQSGNALLLGSAGQGVRINTNNGFLQFAGYTSSYPALKRNGINLEARIADDSGYAPIVGSSLQGTSTVYTNGNMQSPAYWSYGHVNQVGVNFPSYTDITFLTNSAEIMRINSAGNIGIGTTAPTHKLTFDSTASTSGISFYNTSDQTTNYERVRMYWSNNIFNIYNESGGTGGGRSVKINGNEFYYNGNSSFSGVAQFGHIWSWSSGSTDLDITGKNIMLNVNGAERMRIASTGYVGIGTTTPSQKLDVQGGNINTSGTVTANGTLLTSDVRFKKDIQPLNRALEKILNLRGVSYTWRVDEFPERYFNDRKQIGVIAQEVEKEYPEAVNTDDKGFKSVNYSALISPLIESTKELYSRIVNLERSQQHAKALRELASVKPDLAKVVLKSESVSKSEFEKLRSENDEMKKWICNKDSSAPFCKKLK